MSRVDGIISIIKPPGMTSFDVVAWIRKMYSVKKAGHTGTLDPAASGVLPVCLGKGTKIIPYLPDEVKGYVAEITLGVKTDTLDSEGQIIEENQKWESITDSHLNKVISDFQGVIEQVPPMYSAVKYKGKRLYELAREGKKIKREPRQVEIKKINILDIDLPKVKLFVLCSPGTYIRSIARDIGEKLGCGAYLSFLVRTRSGSFNLENSFTLSEIKFRGDKLLYNFDYPLTNHFTRIDIRRGSRQKVYNGAPLYGSDIAKIYGKVTLRDKVLIYNNNTFLAIYRVSDVAGNQINLNAERVFKTS
ncbi:tRNA pseudouridine(55) synthase TruB [Halothermothrix orenii]|uniref:tRNA pseudouridine synthase B n=1 Tax=Halothermothrix orenii (strain H 168 / OCM 544 / DSM 9562) TaxID=373903 RepID=B8CW75_HALOH|nr:tRNA pseudouridine(55) synthase TruB [Halothermothrix orenii]ACL69544.1 tRNA pseudouridine 55 synthase [Halothermothrix orenii H 168]